MKCEKKKKKKSKIRTNYIEFLKKENNTDKTTQTNIIIETKRNRKYGKTHHIASRKNEKTYKKTKKQKKQKNKKNRKENCEDNLNYSYNNIN